MLTYNGEKYLEELLDAIANQDYSGDRELLVVDSTSTDRTAAILASHPEARVTVIPQEEFGHGKTRNLGVRLAKGEIVALLTQDAVPTTRAWLKELVAPFADDSRVAVVFGKQLPRRAAPPVIKYDIQRTFSKLGPDYGRTVVSVETGEDVAWSAAFVSDANSAVRRSVVLQAVPFRDVDYAEDQALGFDILSAGFHKVYAPRAAATHSNDVTFATFPARIEAEITGLRAIGCDVAAISRWGEFKQMVKWSCIDAVYIVRDKELTTPSRTAWLVANPWWHLRKWRAFGRASRSNR